MTPSDSQSGLIVRRATPADLERIGCLDALLVEEHHGFDPQRFLAASPAHPPQANEHAGISSVCIR
jgi:hypothetical protein